MSPIRKIVVAATVAGGLLLGSTGVAAGQEPPAEPPAETEECTVPPLLFQVAFVVDPDSLEGCDFFEDPNYHQNRRDAGLYNENGLFSTIFG